MNNFPWYAAELFLIVCDAGGISAASRFGHAGISQPALSSQIAQLEQFLGKKLFLRKPFTLTPEGKIFRDEATRIRKRMSILRDMVSGGSGLPLRLAASDVILRDHLPLLLKQVNPDTRNRIILREAPSHDLPSLVRDGEIDLAIGLLSPYVHTCGTPLVEKLAQFPFSLHIPPSYQNQIASWQDLLKILQTHPQPHLIALPPGNVIMRHLNTSLRRFNIDWSPTLEVTSLSLVPSYVQLDFGFGFAIQTTPTIAPNTLLIPPDIIPPLTLGVWHLETLDPATAQLLHLIRSYTAKSLSTT